MPRRARLSLAGIPWHIIQRGNNRGVCFFAEEDYRFYLDHLGELAARFGCAVHAYVLMTNHVHLLARAAAPYALSRMMQHVGRRFVQHINLTYRRSGTDCTLPAQSAGIYPKVPYIERIPMVRDLCDELAEKVSPLFMGWKFVVSRKE